MSHPAVAARDTSPSAWLSADLTSASDEHIGALFAGRQARDDAVQELLRAVAPTPGHCWSGPRGVVRLEVVLPDGTAEAVTVRFADDGARLAPADEPGARLRLPLVPLVRLVTGQADAALLHLRGDLEVSGDESLVLALGTALTAGPDRRPLVDPAALDPEAVSVAIKHVDPDHLAGVMAGAFRDLVLREVFGRFGEFVIAEKAARVRVSIAFEIAGRPDGGVDRYVVRLTDGVCVVVAGAGPEEPVDATLELEGHEFLRLVLGHLNPVRGVLSGQLRVRGQVVKALGFNAVMRIPGS